MFYADELNGATCVPPIKELDLSRVKKIGKKVFSESANLEHITFSNDSNLTIEDEAFADCPKLTGSYDFSYTTGVSRSAFNGSNVDVIYSSDSDFIKNAVAVVDGVYYESFGTAFSTLSGKTGEVKLLKDVNISEIVWIPANSNITLDLNGYVIAGNDSCRLFVDAGENSTFTIKDSKPDAMHYYTVDDDGLYTLCEKGTADAHEIKGGIITGANGINANGGAIVLAVNGATLNIYGGNIIGNKAERNGYPAGVYKAGGTVNIYGGSIRGNVNKADNTINDINSASAHIYGGSFTTKVTPESGYICEEDTTQNPTVYTVKNTNFTITPALYFEKNGTGIKAKSELPVGKQSAIFDLYFTSSNISIVTTDNLMKSGEAGHYVISMKNKSLPMGTYNETVTVVINGSTYQIPVTFTIGKVDSTTTAEVNSVTYGSPLKIKVNVQKSEASLQSADALEQDKAYFYYKDTLLGSADVEYANDGLSGSATLSYDTTKKIIPAGNL